MNKNAQLDLLRRSEAEISMAKIDSKVIVTHTLWSLYRLFGDRMYA